MTFLGTGKLCGSLTVLFCALLAPNVSHAWDPVKDITGKSFKEIFEGAKRDAENLPGSWTRCVRNPRACTETTLKRIPYTALLPILDRYKYYLLNQAEGRWENLPKEFIQFAQPHYRTINLRNIRYATNIDTVHGNALTWHNNIYFPQRRIDFRSSDDVRLMLHEIEHTVQYRRSGGEREFISEYILKVVGKVLETGTFNVHDYINLERAANRKADRLWSQVFETMESTQQMSDRRRVPQRYRR